MHKEPIYTLTINYQKNVLQQSQRLGSLTIFFFLTRANMSEFQDYPLHENVHK